MKWIALTVLCLVGCGEVEEPEKVYTCPTPLRFTIGMSVLYSGVPAVVLGRSCENRSYTIVFDDDHIERDVAEDQLTIHSPEPFTDDDIVPEEPPMPVPESPVP